MDENESLNFEICAKREKKNLQHESFKLEKNEGKNLY